MTLNETSGIARTAEVVSSGVPIPRGLNINSTAPFAVVDALDVATPAVFEVLGRWDAPLSNTAAPIQWLLVTFVADAPANTSTSYKLITNGAVVNPAPTSPITTTTVTSGPDIQQVIVSTGVATFRIGLNANQLFDAIEVGATSLLASSDMTIEVLDEDQMGSQTFAHSSVDEITIERENALQTVVVVRGRYAMPDRGDSPAGPIATERRYVFHAGSPTALVRQSISWWGSYCDLQNEWPYIECDFNGTSYDTINGVRIENARITMVPSSATANVVARASSTGATRSEVFSGSPFDIEQQRRMDRFTTRSYVMTTPLAGPENGEAADRALMATVGANHSLAVSFERMELLEPQALRVLADGSLVIDLIADGTWVSGRQGLFTEFAVTALENAVTAPTEANLDRLLWAPRNQPLRPWPSALWFAASNAVDPFPWTALQGNLAQYDTIMDRLMTNTRNNIHFKGLFGMMTYGLYPRYWADSVRTDELDCPDPTPAYDWDNAFWCGSWTDYHNTVAAVPTWVMRSGETHWLDELAFPGAKRMLYTQVMQCSDSDGWFYCGQAPAGYGAYRTDFNSSHAYWDNLILYYWLTGDRSVIRKLLGGADDMRDFLCATRPASPCGPEETIQDYWAQLTGRSTAQWNRAFRFLGLASDQAGYLEDWHSGMQRALTQHYVEQQWSDDMQNYGFMLPGDQGAFPYFCPPWRDPGNPGDNPDRRYWTDQLWMSSLYDIQNTYRLKQDSGDLAVGVPAINPSQVVAATARSLTRFAATVAGAAGDPNGDWPNLMWLLYDESNRIGGIASAPCSTAHPADNFPCINRFPPNSPSDPPANPTAPCVEFANVGGDPLLYDTGKSILSGNLVRGGLIAEDTTVIDMGRTMTEYALDVIWFNLDGQGGGTTTIGSPYGMALGKLMGEYSNQIHSAVALLAAYDAGVTNCAYPSVAGGSSVDCTDFYSMVAWWRDPHAAHPLAQDLNGNSTIDVVEMVAVLSCAQQCP